MDDAIRKIIDFLKQYPFVRYEHREDAIRAFASSETGFEVALLVHAASYTVCYATWHTECSEGEVAMNAFINGLSNCVRLIVVSRGNVDYRWTAQIRRPEGWTSGDTVGIFRYPFWKAKKIRYLQNNYFIAEKPHNNLTWPDLNRSTWGGLPGL